MFGQENFKSYQDYTEYVELMWMEGYINELEEDELLIDEQVRYSNGELSRDITYRLLTEEEYNKKFNG
jgi:hypothetical protein